MEYNRRMEKQTAQSSLPRTKIWPGQEWLHYKGGLYTIIELGVKEDTGEQMVVYKSLTYNSVWIRTVDNWFETVMTSEGEVPRFRELTND